MPKNGYDGPTWEELAEGGMSPSRIEATLAEHGFYDDEVEKSGVEVNTTDLYNIFDTLKSQIEIMMEM